MIDVYLCTYNRYHKQIVPMKEEPHLKSTAQNFHYLDKTRFIPEFWGDVRQFKVT